MTVFDAPVTFSGGAAVVALIAPLRVGGATPGGGGGPASAGAAGAASLLIVNGWLVPAVRFVATVWLAVVNPETLSRFADVPLLNVIVWEDVPIVYAALSDRLFTSANSN